MAGLAGYVTAAVQLGLQSIQVRPRRGIGAFTAQVVFEETHLDELVITDHPVETGAMISDHAFLLPSEVTIKCGWSNSPTNSGLLSGLLGAATGTIGGITSLFTGNSESQVQQMYKNLLDLQKNRIPFDVQTGKRIYNNMLVKSLRVVTDKENENTLAVIAVCRQVMIVSVQVMAVAAPAANQANPAATQSPVSTGIRSLIPAPLYNAVAGAQSFPVRLARIVGIPI